MNLIIVFNPLELNYFICLVINPAWFPLPITVIKNLVRHLLGFYEDYPINLVGIDNKIIEETDTVGTLQTRFIVTVTDENITDDVYQHARRHDLPNVLFPDVGEEILDPGIKARLVDRFWQIQERRERAVPRQQGWFPWLFPEPERIDYRLRRDPDIEGIRRAIALLDKSSACQRVMSWFRKPKESFMCGICHEEDTTVNGGQIWLPCRHSFHLYCIGRNMTRHTTCPYCQAEIDSISRCRPPDAYMGRKSPKKHRRSRRVKKL